MNRAPSLSQTIALLFALTVSGLVVAGPGAAARAQATPPKSGDSRAARLGAAGVKARAALPAAQRAGKSPSKAAAKMSHEQRAALAACVETPVTLPATVNSSLTADDCDLGDGTRYDVYSFSAVAGQQVSFTLTSADFDAYLFVGYDDGQDVVILGEDDNGGGGSNARVPSGSGLATLPYTGIYYVFPNAFEPTDTFGDYTLTLSTAGGTCPASPAAVGFGTVNGSLGAGDCRFVDDTFYDTFTFNGTAGQQVSLSLSSAGFDAAVYLLDDTRNILGANDNGGGGTNARLPATSGFVTLPYTGTYYIVAGQVPPDNPGTPPPTGSYTLTVASGGTCPSTPIAVGQTVGGGALAAGDCMLPDETFYDLYTFEGTAGQQVSISMSSTAFDTFLYLAGTNGQIFAADDDGGGGSNSRIPAGSGVFTLPATGTYHILANSFSAGATGAYTLTLAPAGPAASMFQFSSASFATAEGLNSLTVTVTRTGDTTGAATVDYATTDGTASERRDYTTALGRLRFAAGETSKTFVVLITDDRFDDDSEAFNVTLSNPTGTGATLGSPSTAPVTIADNDSANGPSPVKAGSIDADFFVRQHYADFLNRVPDAGGLAFWVDQMTNCGNADPLVCRVNVSAAFFLSIEFQETGFYAIRVQRVAFGRRSNDPSTRVTYREL
ncbi:MAG TPA: pre-peptidase C-terminal domain-containing protein, partial [Pyrinomonadaceae bacterium]